MIRKQLKKNILIDCVVKHYKRYQKANKNRIQKGKLVGNMP